MMADGRPQRMPACAATGERTSPDQRLESDALARVIAVRDLLNAVLWREASPLSGVSVAVAGLQAARRVLVASGCEASS